MKQYIVDNSKLRNAINTLARKQGKTFSDVVQSTGKISNSIVRKAELRYERYTGTKDFEPDMFGLYAIYYDDVYSELCSILGIDKEILTLQIIDKAEPLTLAALNNRVRELEKITLNLMEEMDRLKKGVMK